jgi:hypothetical protein
MDILEPKPPGVPLKNRKNMEHLLVIRFKVSGPKSMNRVLYWVPTEAKRSEV